MSFFKQFKYVFEIQLLRNAGNLVFFAIIQIMISLGIVVGFTYLFSSPEPGTVLYLATGAPIIILVMTGLVILPNQTITAKAEGYIDFIRTWPVNRAAVVLADTVVWFITTFPGLIVSTICAHFIFHPGYDISWTVVPSILLVALTCIGIGYGYSHALPPPGAMALSQIIAFGALMFSPINFPMERLPEWLQVVHHILPLYSMAEVVRASMAASTFTAEIWHYVVLIIWCIIGYGGSIAILNRK